MTVISTNRPRLIALDWGTSALRAYLLGDAGCCIEQKSAALGILKVAGGNFDAAYLQVCSNWQRAYGPLPVIASGMIGSRQGWLEAPYLPCPAATADIAAQLVSLTARDGTRVHLVPGLSCRNARGVPDVLRGEETQLIGAGAASTDALWVLPGTHSKWVQSAQGKIVAFTTYMTGELYAVLREHSILGRLMTSEHSGDAEAFRRGVDYGLAAEADLPRKLFSARSVGLFGDVPAAGLADYLSGLLLGAEIRDALATLPRATELSLIGDAQLCARYAAALAAAGVSVHGVITDAAALGLWRIARDAALV